MVGRHDTGGAGALVGASGDIDGFLTGVDIALGDHLVDGALLGTVRTKTRNRGGRIEDDGTVAGVHASLAFGQFSLDTALSLAWGTLESERRVRLPSTASTIAARADSQTASFAIEAGYAIRAGAFQLRPVAGLSHVDLQQDGFDEGSSGGLGLKVDGYDLKSTRFYVGLDLEPSDPGAALQPYLRAQVARETDDLARSASARFSVVPEAGRFMTRTVNADRTTVDLGAGLRARVADRISIFADYSGSLGKSTDGHSVRGGLSIAF